MAETLSKPDFFRRSPLHRVWHQGRFGKADAAPGVTFGLRHPADIVTLIARPGRHSSLGRALQKSVGLKLPQPGRSSLGPLTQIHWAGPDQWQVVQDSRSGDPLFDQLVHDVGEFAALSDQSHGRVIIAASGPKVRNVLGKGTAVDLHAGEFAIGACATTQMAHIGVHLARVGEDHFELSLFRGFAENFWEWLTEMSLEVGYQVN